MNYWFLLALGMCRVEDYMHVVPVDIGVVMRESLYIEFIALAFIKCTMRYLQIIDH